MASPSSLLKLRSLLFPTVRRLLTLFLTVHTLTCGQSLVFCSGPYLAGGAGGQLPPLGKLNVDFFNEVFVFDGIFLVAILVQNLKKTG